MARKTVPSKVNKKPEATVEKITKASPKVEKNEKNGKKNGSATLSPAALDDSIIKDSKASKLSQLLKKQNVSAKNPVNFDKFAKDLGWSSDNLSDSDLDLLEEESDDGIIYGEDEEGEFEDGDMD
uniref:Uncharacterized protein n=1 Tax=Panagrolaimus sp. ES5 TaxID=591445 RepID=A0AC34GBC3_9BILA